MGFRLTCNLRYNPVSILRPTSKSKQCERHGKKTSIDPFWGKSNEHEVSCVSALSVYRALDRTKYEATLLGIDKAGRWVLPNQAMLIANNDNPRLINLGTAKKAVTLLPPPE